MQRALRIDNNEIIGADIFDKEVGHGGLHPSSVDLRDSGRCMYCKQPVLIRAGNERVRHFYHRVTGNKVYCPIRDMETEASVTAPQDIPAISEDCYVVLRANWHALYLEMEKHVEGFALVEFWNLLDVAKRSQLLRRKAIVSWMIPYLLLALRDFEPRTAFNKGDSPPRKHIIRFFFVSYTRTSYKRSIWVEYGGLPRLYRWKPKFEDEDPLEIIVNPNWKDNPKKLSWLSTKQLAITEEKIASIK